MHYTTTQNKLIELKKKLKQICEKHPYLVEIELLQ